MRGALPPGVKNRLIPADLDQAIEQLRSDDPIGGVFGVSPHVPVILIDDDPRLKAAEAEARRFEAAFRLGVRQIVR